MAVAFDQSVSSTSVGATTVNIGPVTPTGSDRLLVGFIGTALTGAGPDMTDLNHDSIGTGTEKWDSGDFTNYQRNHAWFIKNPNTNSSNVTYTLSAAPDHGGAVATLFTGVDQTTPFDTEVTKNANDDNPTVDVTSATGDMVVEFFVGEAAGVSGAITLTGDGTLIVEFEDISSYTTVSCSRADGATTVTRSYTWTAGEYWIAAVNMNAAVSLAREQEGYRWRDDDGSESAATWLAAQETNISRAREVNTRVRLLVNYTGDPPSEQVKIQWRKVGDADSEWRDI